MELTLPYDYEMENSVLGSIISNEEKFDEIEKYFINIDVFYQTKAQMLWKRIVQMKKENTPIDTLTICSTINSKDQENGLTKWYITSCTSPDNITVMPEMYASKLYEKYLMRKLIVQSQKIMMSARQNSPDVYDILNQSHSIIGDLLSVRPTLEVDIEKVIEDTIEDFKDNSNNIISTGYSNLDRFAGGLTKGEITIVGGRPGHGKTTVLINMLARAIENGQRAMFFSRELPNSELLKKIICLESQQLSYGKIRQNIFNDMERQLLNEGIQMVRDKYGKDKFLMFDNIKDFSLSANEVKKFKPDIIFDDYIQLIAYQGKEDQRRLQIENLVNNYKWLAKEMNCAVVLASQLNRGIESRRGNYEPQLSDLAESGAIEQVAENVFFTFYDYKVKGEAGKGKYVLTMSAGKVRYGNTGKIDLGYDGDKCKIFNTIEEMKTNGNGTIPF